MKKILLFVCICFFNLIFSQKKESDSHRVKFYLEQVDNEDDLLLALKFKNEFPEIFKYFPDINPIYPGEKHSISSGVSQTRLHPIYKKYKSHNGIDIVAKLNSYVYAAADGIVRKSSFFNGAAGHSVELLHNYGFRTRYFHLALFLVKNGEIVKKGQIIGFLGNTGSSTNPHLHYEVWKNDKVLNPKYFIINKD